MSVTDFEYQDGRLVRAVTTHDPEWLDEDRGWATADLANEAALCPGGCGQPLSETTDPDAEGEYEVPPATRCHACTPLAHAKETYSKSPPGLLLSVKRKEKPTTPG